MRLPPGLFEAPDFGRFLNTVLSSSRNRQPLSANAQFKGAEAMLNVIQAILRSGAGHRPQFFAREVGDVHLAYAVVRELQ